MIGAISGNGVDCRTGCALARGTHSSWLGFVTLGIRWASSWVTVYAAVVLARLERDARLLAVEDFAGRFWGHVPNTVDTAGVTRTLDFPWAIILSIKAEEWRKTECS